MITRSSVGSNKWHNSIVPILLGILFPLNKLAISIGSFELTYFYVLLSVMVIFKMIRTRNRLYVSITVLLIMLLLMTMFITSIWGNNVHYALIRTIKICLVVFSCYNIGKVLANRDDIKKFVFFASVSLAINITVLIYYYVIAGGKLYIANDIVRLSRSGRNTLALYSLVVVCLSFAAEPIKKNQIVLLSVSQIVNFIGIALMQSRGLYIAFIVFVVQYLFKSGIVSKKLRNKVIRNSIFMLFALVVVFFMLPDNITDSFIRRFNTIGYTLFDRDSLKDMDGGGSIIERLGLVKQAFLLFISSPILGLGNGGFFSQVGWLTHNDYMLMLVDLGMVGFFLYAGVLCSIWRRLKRSSLSREHSLFVFCSALVSLYIYFFFINAFDNIATWTMIGIVIQAARINEKFNAITRSEV